MVRVNVRPNKYQLIQPHLPVTHPLKRAGSSPISIVTTSPCILAGWVSVPQEVGLRPRAHLLLSFSSSVVVQLLVVMYT